MALLSVRFSFCIRSAPSAQPSKPVVPENHLKAVSSGLLSGVVDNQDTDAMSVSKLLQLADYLIVAGVAVTVAHRFPDFLQGIHNNQLGVTVFPDKLFQLFIQAAAMLEAGEISKEDYDKWRYHYPEFDKAQTYVKVPPQDLF